jgi:hypothetical protein
MSVSIGPGVAFGIGPAGTITVGLPPFTPLWLFASGSQGVWYDNSNTASMYQDSAGTIPAVLESPVGKQLDLSGNNNHRSQATTANCPILSARYNLLLSTDTLATQSITTIALGYTIYFTGSGSVTLSGTATGTFSAGSNTFTATAGTLTVTVTGSVLTADIRPTNQTVTLPAYQSVTSSTVYDTVGFPQYLKYNGSTSSLETASVNFTATAQMAVFAGLRQSVNATGGEFISFSGSVSTNNGSFVVFAPFPAGSRPYGSISKGTTLLAMILFDSFANITKTLLMQASIPAPSLLMYINGTLFSTNNATQGTGNYGNYPLYFGKTPSGTNIFNGLEYQIVIVGKTLTAGEITNTEAYVNSNTKAY